MEDIEDDRSEVLAAAEVDRGGLQPLAHAASAAAKTTRTNGGFRHRMALLMLDTLYNVYNTLWRRCTANAREHDHQGSESVYSHIARITDLG